MRSSARLLLLLVALLWPLQAVISDVLTLTITPNENIASPTVVFTALSATQGDVTPTCTGNPLILASLWQCPAMRVELIGHFKPCMTEIYLHI